MNIREQLHNHYLFSQLDESQLERVAAMASRRQLHEGERLFNVGDHATHFFMVLSGQIKLSRLAPNGNEKVIELITPGNTFAEALMFADSPTYPVSASAIDDCTLLIIDSKTFTALLRESVDTCFRMMSAMSQRLHRLIKEIDDLTLQSAIGRVAAFLCAQLAQSRSGSAFELEVPKGVIASRLSITPETLSRILGSLSSQGVIRIKGSHISVLDEAGLRSHAASPE